MDFQKRLEKAIERGRRLSQDRAAAEAERALNEEELARLHSKYRLALSERIEACVRQLAEQFPGFRFETIVGEAGWGAAVGRDDVRIVPGKGRRNHFSRLEMAVRPANEYHVLDLAGKATVNNREVFNRSHFERLSDVDLTSFEEMIDHWVLEFAQLYAAKQ
jgi:hypothetical protein